MVPGKVLQELEDTRPDFDGGDTDAQFHERRGGSLAQSRHGRFVSSLQFEGVQGGRAHFAPHISRYLRER